MIDTENLKGFSQYIIFTVADQYERGYTRTILYFYITCNLEKAVLHLSSHPKCNPGKWPSTWIQCWRLSLIHSYRNCSVTQEAKMAVKLPGASTLWGP